MNSIFSYIKGIFGALKSLATGMGITGHYFVRPMQYITQQYPENRATLKMADRFKGEITMPHNENNEHRCTGCGICETACPNGSIEIISNFEMIDGKRKKVIDKHIYHLSMCTFCGLCVDACPSNALDFGTEFEHATFDRFSLTKVLNKEGSKVMKDIKE
jgi:NADH-quinone oxidoreductase subunit I